MRIPCVCQMCLLAAQRNLHNNSASSSLYSAGNKFRKRALKIDSQYQPKKNRFPLRFCFRFLFHLGSIQNFLSLKKQRRFEETVKQTLMLKASNHLTVCWLLLPIYTPIGRRRYLNRRMLFSGYATLALLFALMVDERLILFSFKDCICEDTLPSLSYLDYQSDEKRPSHRDRDRLGNDPYWGPGFLNCCS